ncbi:hypothetical protein KVT40_001568 [Elsinoe batatas]|uniref:Uncharacterized protein n=1 Tax=Elsinoe batatas TaxID=2601811 RepID=A0A8K0L7K6_9PEZI|nr:hypothetical protein KVT40_001568 [Elsinoe batatas]
MSENTTMHNLSPDPLLSSFLLKTSVIMEDQFQPAGRPRRNALERLRHRFYEPLFFLNILNPATGGHGAYSGHALRSCVRLVEWRSFLDSLAWLCDAKHGGKTVSALVGSRVEDGVRFILCSSHQNGKIHLHQVLDIITKANQEPSPPNDLGMQSKLIDLCINFSADKIRTYKRRLQRLLGAIRDHIGPDASNALGSIGNRDKSPMETCCEANKFPHRKILKEANDRPNCSLRIISKIVLALHFVSKLSKWHRVVPKLLGFARRHSYLLQNASCEWLKLSERTTMPSADEKTTVQSALRRMLPKEAQTQVSELQNHLHLQRDGKFEEYFIANYSDANLSLVAHAEVVLLEHVYDHDIRLVEDDRYIGCSKPSCYCCDLYMKYHPGDFVPRPSHGNVYVTWNFPLLPTCTNPKVYEHTLQVMNQVIQHVRRDVFRVVKNTSGRWEKAPDSASGICT